MSKPKKMEDLILEYSGDAASDVESRFHKWIDNRHIEQNYKIEEESEVKVKEPTFIEMLKAL